MLTKEERAGIVERVKRYDSEYDPFYYILFGYPSSCDMPYEEYKEEILNRIFNLCDVSNMVELPLDKDGEVIKVGDIVYNEYGKEIEITRVELVENKWLIDTDVQYPFHSQELTHKKPTTIKSLAQRIRDVLRNDHSEMSPYTSRELVHIANDLERLGDNDE